MSCVQHNIMFFLIRYLVLKIKTNILNFDINQIKHNQSFLTNELDLIILSVTMLIMKKSCFVLMA